MEFDTLWDYNAPSESERKFRKRLPTVTDPDSRAQLLTQIARAQGLQRRFDDAHQTLDEVERMLPRAGRVARARYLLERGRVFNSSGQKEQARPLFQQALVAAEDDFYTIDAAHMIAIVAPPDESLEWNLRAIAIAERATESRTRSWLGSLYNNTAWSLHDLGRYAEALEIFEKALAWREEQAEPEKIHIARWSVARCLRSLGRLEEALAIQQDLANGPNDGYVWEEMGECLLALGKADEAVPYFTKAYVELSKNPWFVSNEPARLERLRLLSKA